jgi:hypothetical protein
MSQVQSSSQAGTPFVWAKLVAGQKQNLLEVEAKEKAKAVEEKAKAVEEKAQAELAQQKRQEQEAESRRISKLKEDLARIGKLAEFEKQNAAEIERQKVLDAKYSRENGWWSLISVRYPDDYYHQQRPIPKTVNEKALRFVQHWLTVFGDQLAPLTTLGQLEEAFQQAVVPNLLMVHDRSSDQFLTWEKRTFGSNTLPNKVRYQHLQQWVATEEKEYQADPRRYGSPPWAVWSLWVFAKNITWQNCLFAMSKVSGTFPGNGLLQITGHFSKPTSAIKWLVPLEPYIGTYFIQKPISAAKRKRLDEEDDDMDWLMGECN